MPQLKQPFQKKHIHAWKMTVKLPLEPHKFLVERHCDLDGCNTYQHAEVSDEDTPTSLLYLADTNWLAGKADVKAKIAGQLNFNWGGPWP